MLKKLEGTRYKILLVDYSSSDISWAREDRR